MKIDDISSELIIKVLNGKHIQEASLMTDVSVTTIYNLIHKRSRITKNNEIVIPVLLKMVKKEVENTVKLIQKIEI